MTEVDIASEAAALRVTELAYGAQARLMAAVGAGRQPDGEAE